MTRLRRFMHLERPRGPGAPERPPEGARDRVAAIDPTADELTRGPAASPPAPPTPSAPPVDRFREPEPIAPDVARPDPAAQPFVRCFRCETDNTVHAARCIHCDEPLDTPPQRAFNERLWTARRAEAERLEAENSRLRATAAAAEEEAWKARKQMRDFVASEAARLERERLASEGWRGGFDRREGRWGQPGSGPGDEDFAGDPRPAGIRLLALFRDPRHRMIAIAVLVAFLVFCLAAAIMSPALRPLLWVAIFVLIGLFAPPRRRRRRFWG